MQIHIWNVLHLRTLFLEEIIQITTKLSYTEEMQGKSHI